MAWIKLTSHDQATGLLRREYDGAMTRAGRIWNIISIMSPNPLVLKASIGLYGAIMFGPSPLSRGQREMLATVVARTVGCRY